VTSTSATSAPYRRFSSKAALSITVESGGVNWLFGSYREPWRMLLRGSFVLFWIVFSANFWTDINRVLIGVIWW
jgi:hypothetical protein